jgi:hypothetical protein
MNVVVNGTIPSGFTQCSGSTVIKISDSTGNSITVTFDLIGFLNAPGGFAVNLASTIINTALDLTIEINPCLTDGTSTCESCLDYVYSNSLNVSTNTPISIIQPSKSISYIIRY